MKRNQLYFYVIDGISGCLAFGGLFASSWGIPERIAIGAGIVLIVISIQSAWYAILRHIWLTGDLIDARVRAVGARAGERTTADQDQFYSDTSAIVKQATSDEQADDFMLSIFLKLTVWIVGGFLLARFVYPTFVAH